MGVEGTVQTATERDTVLVLTGIGPWSVVGWEGNRCLCVWRKGGGGRGLGGRTGQVKERNFEGRILHTVRDSEGRRGLGASSGDGWSARVYTYNLITSPLLKIQHSLMSFLNVPFSFCMEVHKNHYKGFCILHFRKLKEDYSVANNV